MVLLSLIIQTGIDTGDSSVVKYKSGMVNSGNENARKEILYSEIFYDEVDELYVQNSLFGYYNEKAIKFTDVKIIC